MPGLVTVTHPDGDIPTPTLREAVDLHVEGLIEDGSPIPAAQTMAQHQANPDFAGGVWAVVDVPVHRTASGAGRIDEFAKKKAQSRSGVLVEAARTAMHA